MTGGITDTLGAIVPPGSVHPWEKLDEGWRQRLSQGILPGTAIGGLVFPNTQAELAQVMAWAHQNQWCVMPVGSGCKVGWGGLVATRRSTHGNGNADGLPLIAVSTSRLNRLIEHAVGDLTITAEAGLTLRDVQATLAQVGQFLAIDPAYPETATLGGIVATADAGSWRHRYGSVRDMILGLSLVRADGQVVKAGGRVVKNVAGYDLMKLLTGSYGTLGMIAQVTFRVYPLPEASQTVVLSGQAEALEQAAQTLLSSALTPTAVNLLSAPLMEILGLGQTGGLLIRFQSIVASVQQQADRVLQVGQSLGLTATDYPTEDEVALWLRLQELMLLPQAEGAIACKIGIRPTAAVAFLSQLAQWLPDAIALLYAGSGLGQLVLPATTPIATLLQLRQFCQERGGFCSILQAPAAIKQQIDVWGYAGNALEIMRQIKQQFDPNHLLSPHRFVGGI